MLDAMGVMYRAEDDVAELLVPFVQGQRPSVSAEDVAARYTEASLGQLDADAFWRSLGLHPSVEDDYLSLHRVTEGLLDFLGMVRNEGIEVWCLSNDVSRWSVKLRERFAINDLFAGFVVSGDIGHRKPSAEAYGCLLDRVGVTPQLFVDDRPRNVAAAKRLGIPAVCFGASGGGSDRVASFADLAHSRRSLWCGQD
ncbi:MAG: HAD-IA family hydrolase [Gammaproteobacteria bacterium]|nr:HAD-IA family hydrolase [Gammaproteobacteria bacterium]